MRRIADLHPGEGKTDARDAYIIADAARTMPHTLRRVGTDEETLAGPTVLAGYDDDLAAQSTRLTNRLRDALLHVHPALERLLGKHIGRGILDTLAAAPTPAALRALGAEGIAALMRPRSPRLAKTLPTQIMDALDAQTVTVPGTTEFGRVIAGVAAQLRDIHDERASLAADLEARLEAHPLAEVLTSMPGVGVRTALKIPHHRRRRQRVPHRRAPGRLRRPDPGHPPLRLLDQGRNPLPTRQPRLEIRAVLVGIRQSRRPNQPRLLRPQTHPRQAPQRRDYLPGTPPRRRPVRDAPRPQALPKPTHPRARADSLGGLTAAISKLDPSIAITRHPASQAPLVPGPATGIAARSNNSRNGTGSSRCLACVIADAVGTCQSSDHEPIFFKLPTRRRTPPHRTRRRTTPSRSRTGSPHAPAADVCAVHDSPSG